MIYTGENEITGIMLGDTEIYGIYAGDLQLYPTDFGNVTGVSLEDLTWVTDVSALGGTATSANCTYNVYALYDSGKRKRVTNYAEVSGSLVVPETTAGTREVVGTLTLTASYSGFTDSDSVTAYQAARTYNNRLVYTTTDSNALTLPANFASLGWSQNYVSHTYSDGVGYINFDSDLTSIAASAFTEQATLSTIEIPATVTSYGARAFYDCSGMTHMNIPSGVTSIGTGCFYMTSGELLCESQYVVQGNGRKTGYDDNEIYGFNIRFCSPDGNKSNYMYLNFDKLIITGACEYIGSAGLHSSPIPEIVIGDSVTFISGMALARMQDRLKKFEKLTVGSGVTTVGTYSLFYGPQSLNEIYYYPPTFNFGVTSSWFSVSNGTIHYKDGNSGRMTGLPSGWTSVFDL